MNAKTYEWAGWLVFVIFFGLGVALRAVAARNGSIARGRTGTACIAIGLVGWLILGAGMVFSR